VVVFHQLVGGALVEPADDFHILFEEVFLDWPHQAAVAVFANEVNLLQFRVAVGARRVLPKG